MLMGMGEVKTGNRSSAGHPAGCTEGRWKLASAILAESLGVIEILFDLLYYVLNLYKWAIILAAVFSMLAAFGVLDTRNRVVWTIGDFLYRVTEPVLAPVRNILPSFGNIDFSPWVVIILIQIVVIPMLVRLEFAITGGGWRPLVF